MSLPLGVKLKKIVDVKTSDFLAGNVRSPVFSTQADATRAIVDILRQSFGNLAAQRGFHAYKLANRVCWYPKRSIVGDEKIPFDAHGVKGGRQLLGRHKEFFWHYAVSIDVAWTPPSRITASGHVLFSLDGETILSDTNIAVKLRRKALRSKRNAWWRDVMLSYFARISQQEDEFGLPLGGAATDIRVSSSPISFVSPLRLEFDSDFSDLSDSYDDPILQSDEDDEPEDGDPTWNDDEGDDGEA